MASQTPTKESGPSPLESSEGQPSLDDTFSRQESDSDCGRSATYDNHGIPQMGKEGNNEEQDLEEVDTDGADLEPEGDSEITDEDRKFMQEAKAEASNSLDPCTKVGAVIVTPDRKEIVGRGWNRKPKDWNEEFDGVGENEPFKKGKHYCVMFAVEAAMFDSREKRPDLKGCIVYTTLFPSEKCAKCIREMEIAEVVYIWNKFSNEKYTKYARRMLKGIRRRQCLDSQPSLEPVDETSDVAISRQESDSDRNRSATCGNRGIIEYYQMGKEGNNEEQDLEEVDTDGADLEPEGDSEITDEDRKFMQEAKAEELNSLDPDTQVGAVIVTPDRKEIVGRGWNKKPKGCENEFVGESEPFIKGKHYYVVFAVEAATFDSWKKRPDLKGCIVYTTLFPSAKCAKWIREMEIAEVVYIWNKFPDAEFTKYAKMMLKGIRCRQCPDK